MTTTQLESSQTSDTAVFLRLLNNGRGAMSVALARYILKLGFTTDDQARMTELAARNQDATISDEERAELRSFVKAGHFLALFHSRARKALEKRRGNRVAHG